MPPTRVRPVRGPRGKKPRQPSQAFHLCKLLRRDQRFRSLAPTHQIVLLHAVLEYADADGAFFPRRGRWADAAGVDRSTVNRAIHAATQTHPPLLFVTPHARENGQQTSSTYHLDPHLVVKARNGGDHR